MPIHVARRNVLLMLKTFEMHSKWRNIERRSKYRLILSALWLHSKYSNDIPIEFETFWSDSMENQDGKPLQILSECPECVLADFILR